ncbi:MAG: ribosome biogenesis GTP-binding protein YihA/YsxC [Proteobacteria bacterium]|nr:ribosome biogenesis GTP-binding protein YihA/YsxC [Pseudomonadota bacterium]
MKIISAEFVKSTVTRKDYPGEPLPEVAFAGRSNVGKSSLINTLLNKKNLARISSTPGRTQTINFFRINQKFFFVDLPGYGFAHVPMEVKKKWKPMVEEFLSGDSRLKLVILIIDVRRDPNPEDATLLEWFRHYSLPFLVVMTKVDKVSRNEAGKQKQNLKNFFGLTEEEIIPFSAVTGEGRNEIWKKIESAIEAGSKESREASDLYSPS